jgi:chromate transporter
MAGTRTAIAGSWREIAASFFKLGATSFGGPAIMGIMQAELQEKRRWVSKERFLEGLAVANMLPGATATQLGIFLGYARGGWAGGLLGGACFVLPAFIIMLGLTIAYAGFSVTPVARGALYGLGPVVLGLYAVAVYRLGRAAFTTVQEMVIGVLGAAAAIGTSLGVVVILVLAGIAGLVFLQPARPRALWVTLSCVLFVAILTAAWWLPMSPSVFAARGGIPDPGNLWDLGIYFLKVGAFTIGGGLAMIAFIQDQVVGQYGWLTAREFIDGLALGQLTPGPVLMIAAYVGYKAAGPAGAAVAGGAAFLPSFVIMLGVLPILDRVRKLAWVRAVMKGMAPAVIGVLAVSLSRLTPAALPDAIAVAILAATLFALVVFQIGAFRLMIAGAVVGVLRSSLPAMHVVRAARHLLT